MFIDDASAVRRRLPSTRVWVTVAAAMIAALLVGLQIASTMAGFQGPLHSLLSDYLATPKSTTVPWVGLGVALVGVTARYRIYALSAAVALDLAFAAERLVSGGAVTLGNGPLIVLTVLTGLAWWRWQGEQRTDALRAATFGILFILATKVGDAWLKLTPIIRPNVLDEYVLAADQALGQPSWVLGRVLEWAGPLPSALLEWVYIELPFAAMVVALYQLRHVTTAGWPKHFIIRTFLLLGLIGPLIYVVFPVVGPNVAFGDMGLGFQVGDFWPNVVPSLLHPPTAIPFDAVTPRNCMPSMHTAWALAVFLHTRRSPRWLRWGGAFWLLGTIWATLGFGGHYGVDLVAGALLCLTVESTLREQMRGDIRQRLHLVACGTVLFVAVLVSCRFLSEQMAEYPLVFGPLLIGGLAGFSAAFYWMFFSRAAAHPLTPADSALGPRSAVLSRDSTD